MSDASSPRSPEPNPEALSREDWSDLREAYDALSHHGLADRLTELLGTPITASIRMLPQPAENLVHGAVEKALQKALEVAVATIDQDHPPAKPRLLTHKALAGLAGGVGGAFGLAAVAAELPVSTVLILRSIADIARSQGEDLSSIEARLACLEVFALDGGTPDDKTSKDGTESITDASEIGYFAVRAGMSKHVTDAAKFLAKGSGELTAPPLLQLIQKIGGRFGIVVSEKMAAQAIPVIGAVGGALINSYFIDHYQDLARAHFAIRRLERDHGEATIQAAYATLGDPIT